MKTFILSALMFLSVSVSAYDSGVDPLDVMDTTGMSAAPKALAAEVGSTVGHGTDYLGDQFKRYAKSLESDSFKFSDESVLIGPATTENGDPVDSCSKVDELEGADSSDCHVHSFLLRRNFEKDGEKWAVAAFGYVGSTRKNKFISLVVFQVAVICGADYCK